MVAKKKIKEVQRGERGEGHREAQARNQKHSADSNQPKYGRSLKVGFTFDIVVFLLTRANKTRYNAR
jgi:hypothetical protein